MNNVNIETENLDLLINKLENSFTNINNCFSMLDNKMNIVSTGNNEVWDSPSQRKMYEYYLNIKKLFPLYESKFSSYITFLRNVSENYKQNELKSNNTINTNEANLNVFGGV